MRLLIALVFVLSVVSTADAGLFRRSKRCGGCTPTYTPQYQYQQYQYQQPQCPLK